MSDITGVCETKLNKISNDNFILLIGYNFNFVNSMSNARVVAIYMKNSTIYSIIQDLNFKSNQYD